MAPRRGESIERNEEREEFLKKLAEYHEKRGTTLDPEPKVGPRHIDLLKLYNRVIGEGGYDLCSDTKAKPLMWRGFAEEFIGKNPYTAAQAFQVKNVYYKNLVAYEISTHWGKEPPPRDILEDITAKGGNVMGRTRENFQLPGKETFALRGSGEEGTSDRIRGEGDTKADDDPGSGIRTRGLRQQPPQRVLFQPDLAPARQQRAAPSVQHTPLHLDATPGHVPNGIPQPSTLSYGATATLASYEPQQSYPLSLKPVATPANNPEFYRNERKRKLEENAGPLARKYRNIMLPGTGFGGPNIYVRAQMALQSGIPEEEQYALHHLVKISHERGDKYKFDQFTGLAEALLKKALQITGLFYDIEYDVSYSDEIDGKDEEVLDGLQGTSETLRKLSSSIPTSKIDRMEDATFQTQFTRIFEAGLILRNMSMQEENARYLARLPLIRDYLAVVLGLPQVDYILELQVYALETAEQVLKYSNIGPRDELYRMLLLQLDRSDRGVICLALRTLSRIAMSFEMPKKLEDIPESVLTRVQEWLLLEDEELRSATLDFLMQYTSFSSNVEELLRKVDGAKLAEHLGKLLVFSAKEQQDKRRDAKKWPEPVPAIAELSQNIIEALLDTPEPERSSEWLRMCFTSNANSEMTQISLWQAYQRTFAPHSATHPPMIAGDFIKNVSNTFTGATAQVAGSNRYVIKGVRAREVPVESSILAGSQKGREMQMCQWRKPGPQSSADGTNAVSLPIPEVPCGIWHRDSEALLQHILVDHLRLPVKAHSNLNGAAEDVMEIDETPLTEQSQAPVLTNGTSKQNHKPQPVKIDFAAALEALPPCRWGGCGRHASELTSASTTIPRALLFARHIHTHLPDNQALHRKHNINGSASAKSTQDLPLDDPKAFVTTLSDEKNDAAGIPRTAALVLRNIAKFMPQRPAKQMGLGGRIGDEDEDEDDEASGEDEPKVAVEGEGEKKGEKKATPVKPLGHGPIGKVFDAQVRERLFHALAHNRTIQGYVDAVLKAAKESGL